jgi:hypothetical protein
MPPLPTAVVSVDNSIKFTPEIYQAWKMKKNVQANIPRLFILGLQLAFVERALRRVENDHGEEAVEGLGPFLDSLDKINDRIELEIRTLSAMPTDPSFMWIISHVDKINALVAEAKEAVIRAVNFFYDVFHVHKWVCSSFICVNKCGVPATHFFPLILSATLISHSF